MKKSFHFFLGLLLFTVILTSCKKPETRQTRVETAFHESVSAYTSGIISVSSTLRIRLAEPPSTPADLNTLLPDKFVSINPPLKGTTYWVDQQSIEFRPAGRLKPGTVYRIKLDLQQIIEVPKEKRYFEFDVETLRQSIKVEPEGFIPVSADELKWNRFTGKLYTNDVVDETDLEGLVLAKHDGRILPVFWEHGPRDLIHHFTIDSIERKESAGQLYIEWNGDKIGAAQKDNTTRDIPALGDFRILDVKVVQQPEQYALIRFSDPLQKNQNLSGLVRFTDQYVDLRFLVEKNELRIYPAVRQAGNISLVTEAGIRNILGYRLGQNQQFTLTFESMKPAVRLPGKGVILPHSSGLMLPFEAVNLSAVDVSVIKIYENNMAQFLQVNQLDGNYQLRRAGRMVARKTIALKTDRPVDFGAWNSFSLDLSELITPDPGSVYRLEIGFRKQHSMYECDGTNTEQAEETAWSDEDELEREFSYWDAVEEYYYDDYGYYYYYSWDEREDPCSPAYYGKHRSVSRNILASDLGIIAKGGNNRAMVFAVTDLRTTDPLSRVKLEVYNYQQQLIATTETNAEGLAEVQPGTKPFLLIAKHGKQRGYLRLDDGSSLSVSTFDVSGSMVQKGLKGYIYGERGVWRPGDSLYLTFLLEDEQNQIPAGHPVTFELTDPRGQLVKRTVRTSGTGGFFPFATATSPDAPTGYWNASVKLGGVTFSKSLRIETVKPNRLKINLDFGKDMLSAADRQIRGELYVRWLHGAVAKNLRADVKTSLSSQKTHFEKFSGYDFDDPVRRFWSDEITLFDGRVDETGKALVKAGIGVEEAAPGMLQANFIVRAFEESGDFSTDRFSIPYSPYTSYVGLLTPPGDQARGMLLTDTTHHVEMVTVDMYGNPVERKELDVKIYKIEWRWWWEGSEENLASYIGSHLNNLVHEEKVSTRKGKASFPFRIDYPEWGRYLIRVTDPVSGHASGKVVYIDWPGYAGRAGREHPGAAAVLSFSVDKEKYKAGETVGVSLPSPTTGRALVSLENGSGVLDAFWVPVTSAETHFQFKTTTEMCPNIYVHISLLQPHAQTANDLPVRLYGVISLPVEDPSSMLQPGISMPEVLRPEEKVNIRIREETGKNMSYTLAMVDEGLLDLTRFRTPDPWSVFYAREALGVRTWDIYDLVLGAYGGKIEKVFSIGGDGDREPTGPPARAVRFRPVVRFAGPFFLEGGKTASHTFEMPRYVGSVRTMVVAGYKGAYGNAEITTPVRSPLMVLATLPRVIGPEEELQLPVTVFAMEPNIKKVSIEVTTNNYLLFNGPDKSEIAFAETGDQLVYFNLKSASRPGVAKTEIRATSGREKAVYDLELDVRNPNPRTAEYTEAAVGAGQEWLQEFRPVGMPGTNSALLEVSAIPPIDFGRRLKYLLTYPHGCIEQIVSAAFPQLFLPDVMETDEKLRKKTEDNVKEALIKIRSFQLPDGSVAYWPGQSSNDWGSSYAGHFMLEAEAKGYSLPPGMKESWLKYQKKEARQWSPPKGYEGYFRYALYDLAQAYRLYTLALAGEPVLSAMNRLRENAGLSVQAKWRLAAAYVLAGQTEVARRLTQDQDTRIDEYEGSSYCYGSDIRDKAMILETMSLMENRDEAIPLMKEISEQLSRDRWMSTQSTAYCLLAMSKFAGGRQTTGSMKFDFSLNEAALQKASSDKPVVQIPLDPEANPGTVRLINKGENILFARIVTDGIPPAGRETESTNSIDLQVIYKDLSGQTIDISKLRQGTDFVVEVTIRNLHSYRYLKDLALTQVFASGWEIRNTRLDGTGLDSSFDLPDYQDIRDDRVLSYFDLGRGKKKTFVVQLNAAYLGKFYLPGPSAEAMYDPDVRSRRKGQWVEVIRPDEN